MVDKVIMYRLNILYVPVGNYGTIVKYKCVVANVNVVYCQ